MRRTIHALSATILVVALAICFAPAALAGQQGDQAPPPAGPQLYPPPGRGGPPARLRLEVKPKQAQVYVDGYFMGSVDDYDGMFQRLRIPPGEHEIVLYLQGYRTIRQTLKLRPGADYKVREDMVRLAAGQVSERPPTPPPLATSQAQGQPSEPPMPPRPRRPMRRMPPDRGPTATRGFGTLAVRVQPPGAEVTIDGGRWQSPQGDEPLVVQLSTGPHRIEIRKDGYTTYTGEVRIREGETSPLNVNLSER